MAKKTQLNRNNQKILSAQDIDALLQYVKKSNRFSVDTNQYLLVYHLVNQISRNNQKLESIDRWAYLIGPIICNSPDEQSEFYNLFECWVDEHYKKKYTEQNDSSHPLKRFKMIFLGLGLFVLFSILSLFLPENYEINLKGFQEVIIQVPEKSFNRFTQHTSYFKYTPSLILIALLIIAYIMVIRESRYRKILLRRDNIKGDFQLSHLKVSSRHDTLFHTPDFRRRFTNLSKHIVEKTELIDAKKTVHKAIQAGGVIVPQYENRKRSPEYLLLIDADSGGEHSAKIGQKFAEAMRSRNIFVETFYFFGDARFCYKERNYSNAVELKMLAKRYSSKRLILITRGNGLVNNRTLQLANWATKAFSYWQQKVLLTPVMRENWNIREKALAKAFSIFPCDSEGYQTFSGFFDLIENLSNNKVKYRIDETKNSIQRYPGSLQYNETLWILNDKPDDQAVHNLVHELEVYLGEFGFKCLCACAVFPKLIWEITNFLYDYLAIVSSIKEEKQETLYNLTCLPWFEQGYLPDYLRLRLLAELSASQRVQVRDAIYSLLYAADNVDTQYSEINFGFPLDENRKKMTKGLLKRHSNNYLLKDGLVAKCLDDVFPEKTDFSLPENLSNFIEANNKVKIRKQSTLDLVNLVLLRLLNLILVLIFILVGYFSLFE